jgi:hypothetical protein
MILTKKNLPQENSNEFSRLSKMARSINADKAAAWTFQLAEVFLEVVAFSSIFFAVAKELGAGAGVIWGVSIGLGLICSVALQGQFTNNIIMAETTKHDADLQSIASSNHYKGTAVFIALFLLFLNVFGAYTFGHQFIETTKGLEETAQLRHEATLKQLETTRNSTKAAAADFDMHTTAINTKYNARLTALPNEARSTEKRRELELREKLNQKIQMLASADSVYRADKATADKMLAGALATIKATNEAEYKKQATAESWLLVVSVVSSLFLLFLTYWFHSRSIAAEIQCGVSYTVVLSTNQTSPFALWRFVVGNFLNSWLSEKANKLDKYTKSKFAQPTEEPETLFKKKARFIKHAAKDRTKNQYTTPPAESVIVPRGTMETETPETETGILLYNSETPEAETDKETVGTETPETETALHGIQWIDGNGNGKELCRKEAQDYLNIYLDRAINGKGEEGKERNKALFEQLKKSCNSAGYAVEYSVSETQTEKTKKIKGRLVQTISYETKVRVSAPEALKIGGK